ncbi:glycosyltransferase family 2 protein [Paenibacillus cremeus]|uniref:Glycosyltransferase family 2 protein n=1 Tax=Paenibacillus cremeus TaxID=2163881 RepID=A0A559K500_9BACL|nr:glycosyltransferase family 2 protein [Paenibacillus cremeus]TVY07219.1 glycosyltransferase family 2 protein [Paenibacillus cremeus]
MNEILVSIIVPVYNNEEYLPYCIESILGQSYSNFELILVDDGSKDNGNTICRKFEFQDKRVKVYYQQNSGASAARNLGIENASGKYLMFVDADDYIEKDMLQLLIETAEHENADFVMCGMMVDTYNSQGDLILSVKHNMRHRIILGNINIPINILDLVENEKINGPCCKLIKTYIVKMNDIRMPHHISLQEDLYFNLKVLEHANKVCVIESTLYHYNKRPGESVTSRYYAKKYDMTNDVHDLLMEYFVKRCNDEKVLARIKFIYIKNVYAAFINLFHKNCDLTRKEKINYIATVIKSKKFSKMVSGAYKPGLKYRLLMLFLVTKSKLLIYYISKLFSVLKYSFGFRY